MTSNLDPNRSAAGSAIETRSMREILGQGHLSRREAIMAVQSMTSFRDLFGLRNDPNTFNTNTWAIDIKPQTNAPSYPFCVAPQSQTVNDAIEWAEFWMSFVEASLSCALPQLLRLPPTHAGLHRFLAGRNRGTVSVHDRNTLLTRRFESERESGRGDGDHDSWFLS